MKVDDGMDAEAGERADRTFPEWMTEDQRWEAFREILAEEPGRQRESVVHHLMLMELLHRLYPRLDSARWKQFGWNDVLGGRLSPEAFIHRVRLAKAAGSKTGRL